MSGAGDELDSAPSVPMFELVSFKAKAGKTNGRRLVSMYNIYTEAGDLGRLAV